MNSVRFSSRAVIVGDEGAYKLGSISAHTCRSHANTLCIRLMTDTVCVQRRESSSVRWNALLALSPVLMRQNLLNLACRPWIIWISSRADVSEHSSAHVFLAVSKS